MELFNEEHMDQETQKLFSGLNELLEEFFRAERLYYDAAEDLQQVDFKRFLNHESVNRNRFATKLIFALSQAGVDPSRLSVPKGNKNRTAIDTKNILEKTELDNVLTRCYKQDTKVIQGIDSGLAHREKFNADIYQLLVRSKNEILASNIALKEMQERLHAEEAKTKHTKIRRLKAI
ncbi:DUF2383 domain-containing protein [Croceiramulus getboli]|nr:DUF2383 domain-containing protein [Flavobacteriaceae bacterium YJPT1-3]